MMGRGAIVAALVVYLGVTLGCVLNSTGDSTKTAAQGSAPRRLEPPLAARSAELPFRGVSMQLHHVGWVEQYKRSIDEIAELGADTLQLVVDARMENGSSSRIYIDMRFTAGPDMLGELIDYAKGKGLRVILMPIVLLDKPRGMEWRGTINPEDWSDWWNSYRGVLQHFCLVAEAHKVDVLVVGSELVSTESKADQWLRTIAMVRQLFKGMITYSANWDHFKDIPFWEQLDLIGMNSYWKLGDDHTVPVAEIERRWARIQENVLSFTRRKGKPLIFLEAGWCSLRNAAHEPWDYTRTEEPMDLELQRKLYEGFFRSWHGNPALGGFSIWEWPPGDGGPGKDYTPEGKPAEQVLREWLEKPKWEVR